MTGYIYPLAEPIELSPALGIYLDNPRSAGEIDDVATCLKLSFDHPGQRLFTLRNEGGPMSIEEVLLEFGSTVGADDEVVSQYFTTFQPARLFEFLAGMWIVARYDDEGSLEELDAYEARPDAKGHHLILIESEDPLIKNADRVVHYSHLLSLLSHTQNDEYFGRGFLVEREYPSLPRRDSHEWLFNREFLRFAIHTMSWRGSASLENEPERWSVFPHALAGLLRAAEQLEQLIESGHEMPLLYVGNILALASPETLRDLNVRLLLLVSILEAVLTHNPDFQRFNVEDSISKQFQLKVSLLVYLADPTYDLQTLKKRVRAIYSMRSNVAHGNFGALVTQKKSTARQQYNEDLEDVVRDLYAYLRRILFVYASDPALVTFLKES